MAFPYIASFISIQDVCQLSGEPLPTSRPALTFGFATVAGAAQDNYSDEESEDNDSDEEGDIDEDMMDID